MVCLKPASVTGKDTLAVEKQVFTGKAVRMSVHFVLQGRVITAQLKKKMAYSWLSEHRYSIASCGSAERIWAIWVYPE